MDPAFGATTMTHLNVSSFFCRHREPAARSLVQGGKITQDVKRRFNVRPYMVR